MGRLKAISSMQALKNITFFRRLKYSKKFKNYSKKEVRKKRINEENNEGRNVKKFSRREKIARILARLEDKEEMPPTKN